MERDFTKAGRMKRMRPEDQARTKGHMAFYSVDTREEVDALVELALKAGEFARNADGTLVETTLMWEQTIDNLNTAADNLAALHAKLRL